MPLSDDACDRLVASRDPVDLGRLRDEAVADVSRRLRDELLAELAGGLSAAPPAARRRRPHGLGSIRRRVVAATALAAAAAGMLALVGSLPAGGGHGGPLEVPAASAAVALDRAAQAAMRSATVVPGPGQYGFVQVDTGSVLGQGQGDTDVWVRISEVKSDWYTTDGSGRERIVRTSTSFLTHRDRAVAQAHRVTLATLTATFPRIIDGAFPARTLQTAGLLPYWKVGRLPTRPTALRRALERLLVVSAGRTSAARSLSRQVRADPGELFGPISQFLLLPTSPQLRAALFRVLAGLPGVQLLGHRRDRLGRSGIAVAITHGRPDRIREELLFDPATSNLLQTQAIFLRSGPSSASGGPGFPPLPRGTVIEYTDFVSRGVVSSITRLPGGRRLPINPADGSR